MGFFDDLFGAENSTANQQYNHQRDLADMAFHGAGLNADADRAASEAFTSGAQSSMGANAGEMLNNANAAASPLAGEQAGRASAGAAGSAESAAKSAGLSPAEAAMLGSHAGGDTYQGSYNENLNRNMDRYNQDTGQFLNAGLGFAGQSNSALGAANGAVGSLAGSNAGNAASTGAANGASAIGSIATGIGSLIPSDKNLKQDAKPVAVVDKVKAKLGPVSFKYKSKVGDPGQQIGVMAQDLEKTPLKTTVVDTPDGKMVDTRKLTTANTGMITELGDKIDKIVNYIKKAI